MFSKILIANRGEVAVRIIRACKEMGIETVAVYSEADQNSLPVALADERICIGSNAAADSYLNQKNIISAALASNAEAIHPGYGFLSENPEFAALCEEKGIIFIGPDSNVLRAMGDKDNSRQLMKEIGVPVVPGTEILHDPAEAKRLAAEIGYPILVKATAGGGGKGIRVVEREEDLEHAFLAASEEAKSAFGNGDVFLEKYLTSVRHVEMQVLADAFGNIVCLGERDCSLQLNKQKVLEETPCPVMTEDIRKRMMDAAVKAAKAANYVNAGTVEFLLAPDGNFYFIEMNTRLQVEHPITEEISDVDIVKWQIRIACQIPLDFTQEDIHLHGHSMECRINARSTGQVDFLHIPGGSRVHFDTALVQDCLIVPFYDSMIGKLIVYAKTREDAIRKMEAALCEMVIHGIHTNIEDQLRLVRNLRFQKGDYDTLILPELLAEGGTELE
ncbi:acetyl-CoA carboxylase biotin carboxylase subunit [Anaerotignum sp.]|uniref:acetyl-CoA carboxylase biotin carboxylase subunit n=1 Tax=Anaerotignum sp. TaxID=2039241 RepID=UPI0027B9D47C|nr:acetyl-CoA carboxylase biotin carboxylase subunit [Anaerotignum sp.]